ncbi:MAG: dihydroorotase [Ruminococcus sp.]
MIKISNLIIKNVRVISPAENKDEISNIYIRMGKISDPFKAEDSDTVIDGTGLVAMPGLVDLHVHLRDPGQTDKEDIVSGTNAAAAGGVTSLLCMPNTDPTIDNAGVISYILDKAKNCKSRVYVAGSITKGLKGREATDLLSLRKAGAIGLSDDGRPVLDPNIMAEAMKNAPKLGMTVVAHCEDLSLAEGGKINEGKMSEKLGIKGIPNDAENNGTEREIILAEKTDSPVHICHVSTKESVELIRKAKKRGVKVTAETAPHYFTLTEDILENENADCRMNPPLRTEEDRKAIIEGLLDGTIDCIATDHAPHTEEDKADFVKAPNGSIGMETSLAVTLTQLYHNGKFSLLDIAGLMSTAPANILKINAGTIKTGADADIAIVDVNKTWTVDREKLHGKSKNTPFHGMELKGKVVMTILGGKIVFQD